MQYATKEDIESLRKEMVILQKKLQEVVNSSAKAQSDFTEACHGTSSSEITKINAAVMDLSSEIYSSDTSDATSDSENTTDTSTTTTK